MPGHEKFLKTSMKTVTGQFPDYIGIVIDSNRGPAKMTLEHLGLCEGLSLPFFFILTKTDIAQDKQRELTKKKVQRAMSNERFNKQVIFIENREQVDSINYKNIESGFTVPVFVVSAKRGDGIDSLRYFLSKITPSIARIQNA